MAQHLNAAQKREIEKLYVSGVKPAEIACRLDRKPASVRQHLYRAGLTKQREEIAEVKKQTALEVLAEVRQERVEDLKDVLDANIAGLKNDAQQFRNGWNRVHNAADAAHLMKGKSLHLDCTFKLFGVDKADSGLDSVAMGLNFFVLSSPPTREEKRVEPVDAAKPVETIPR